MVPPGTGMGVLDMKPPESPAHESVPVEETGRAPPQGHTRHTNHREDTPQPSRFAKFLKSVQDSVGRPGSHSFWIVARSGILIPAATWSWVCEFARSDQTAKLPPRIWPSYLAGTGVVPRTTSGVHCS